MFGAQDWPSSITARETEHMRSDAVHSGSPGHQQSVKSGPREGCCLLCPLHGVPGAAVYSTHAVAVGRESLTAQPHVSVQQGAVPSGPCGRAQATPGWARAP